MFASVTVPFGTAVVEHEHRTARLISVIEGEFTEMPGMRLTRSQFRRLWNLSRTESDRVIKLLIENGFLVEGLDGLLRRRLDVN